MLEYIGNYRRFYDIIIICQNTFHSSDKVSGMIELTDISKTFKVYRSNAGFREAVRSLFKRDYTYVHALRLDEPTIGLDAVSKTAVRNFIRKMNHEKNTTVILTTHDMQDIEALTERILLIGRGRILLDGSLSELKMRYSGKKKISVQYGYGQFSPHEGITPVKQVNGHAVFEVDTTVFGGVIVFSGLFLVYASLCFFTTEGLEVMNILTDGGREFGRYPLSVYGEGFLKFFTYVVPLALFQYYPLLYITGRSENLLYMFLPVIGSLFKAL